MSVEQMPSLPRHFSPEQVRRAHDLRRAGMAVLLLVVGLGLSTFLGAHRATTASTAAGYTMSVTHVVVTRPAIPTPLRVDVHHADGFEEPITLAISRQLFERFDFQNFYPNPSAELGSDDYVYYTFDPPPGERFRLSLDARTAPDQNGSIETYRVALVVAGRPVTDIRFRMVVMP